MALTPQTIREATYHHGDLAHALEVAGLGILAEDGIEALTLRAVTRRAGVSATAAVPHFGNLTGLRSAIAGRGYAELAGRLGGAKGRGTVQAGLAYLDFALASPDLYRLMFRRELLDFERPELAVPSKSAFAALAAVAGGGERLDTTRTQPIMAGLWGKVHGLALLAIDGMLAPLTPAENRQELLGFLEQALG